MNYVDNLDTVKFFTTVLYCKVVKHLQDVNFTLQSGERVYFDGNGDPAATYELVNWQRNPAGDIMFVAVGSYDASLPSGKQFTMNGINITWAAESPKVTNVTCMYVLYIVFLYIILIAD